MLFSNYDSKDKAESCAEGLSVLRGDKMTGKERERCSSKLLQRSIGVGVIRPLVPARWK